MPPTQRTLFDDKKARVPKPGKFYWIDNALNSYAADIGPHGLAVYTVLALHANHKTQTTKITLSRLSRLSGLGTTKLTEVLNTLVKWEIIKRISGKAARQANVYLLLELEERPAEVVEETSRVAVSDSSPDGEWTSRVAVTNQVLHFNQEKNEPIKTPPLAALVEFPVDRQPGFMARQALNGQALNGEVIESSKMKMKAITEAIHQEYQYHNPGFQTPFTGKFWGMLKREVERMSCVPVEKLVQAVHNYYASDGIDVGGLPENMICYLSRYFTGPLDRFNKLKERKEGESTNGYERLAERNDRIFREATARLRSSEGTEAISGFEAIFGSGRDGTH